MIRAAVAQAWGAATAKACGKPFPDCGRCRRPGSDALRASWGCEEEAPHAVWESTCTRCAGNNAECAVCDGDGILQHRRCPSAMVHGASPGLRMHIDLLFRAYSHYDRRNVLPVSGAWLDQSRSFLAGVDMIDAERGYWDGLREEHLQEEVERSQRKADASSRRGSRRR